MISSGSNSGPGFIFFPRNSRTNLRIFITRGMYQGFERTSLSRKQNELDLGLCQELLDSISSGRGEAGNKILI